MRQCVLLSEWFTLSVIKAVVRQVYAGMRVLSHFQARGDAGTQNQTCCLCSPVKPPRILINVLTKVLEGCGSSVPEWFVLSYCSFYCHVAITWGKSRTTSFWLLWSLSSKQWYHTCFTWSKEAHVLFFNITTSLALSWSLSLFLFTPSPFYF